MSRFTGALDLRVLDEDNFKVLGVLAWDVGHEGSGVSIVCSPGDITDLASMPFKWMRRGGKKSKPAAIHDKGYKKPFSYAYPVYRDAVRAGLWVQQEPVIRDDVRLFMDTQFYEACRAVKIGTILAWVYYRGVRFGGEDTWNERWEDKT